MKRAFPLGQPHSSKPISPLHLRTIATSLHIKATSPLYATIPTLHHSYLYRHQYLSCTSTTHNRPTTIPTPPPSTTLHHRNNTIILTQIPHLPLGGEDEEVEDVEETGDGEDGDTNPITNGTIITTGTRTTTTITNMEATLITPNRIQPTSGNNRPNDAFSTNHLNNRLHRTNLN
jgi:hypothetical protein